MSPTGFCYRHPAKWVPLSFHLHGRHQPFDQYLTAGYLLQAGTCG